MWQCRSRIGDTCSAGSDCGTFGSNTRGETVCGHYMQKQYFLRILLTVALKCIAARWLKLNPPTSNSWVTLVQEVHEIEQNNVLWDVRQMHVTHITNKQQNPAVVILTRWIDLNLKQLMPQWSFLFFLCLSCCYFYVLYLFINFDFLKIYYFYLLNSFSPFNYI